MFKENHQYLVVRETGHLVSMINLNKYLQRHVSFRQRPIRVGGNNLFNISGILMTLPYIRPCFYFKNIIIMNGSKMHAASLSRTGTFRPMPP